MADPIQKPHAVLIPMPLQGHIVPAVELAINLAAKGFTITFVNTEAIHYKISQANHSPINHDIFSNARASGLDIRYELISDGLPISFDRSRNDEQSWYAHLYLFSTHVEHLIMRKLLLTSPPVTCLIADTFFVWPSTVAKKLGLTYVSFWTEPATVFTLFYHMDLLVTNGHHASQENRKGTITYIPGVPAIEPTDLMSYLQVDMPPMARQMLFKAVEETKGADFVLCNTVEELELESISALQREKPFYAVGPIFPVDFTRSTVAASLWTESDCSRWLDSKPAGSVLYISFGSYANVSKRDLEEIAYGILDSKADFIWAIRRDIVSSDEPEPLPKEFLEECHERGVVVPWCCQREVLSHPSIGGFLTHCGWNSVLESIWCAVPLLCFPLLSDQITNRKLVVQDWKIGIEIGGLNAVSRNEVSKKIGSLMRGEMGFHARKEIKELKKVLEGALTPTKGSSQKNFDQFIEDLQKNIQKKANK